MPATLQAKAEAAVFLSEQRASGRTDPVPALMRAFDVLRHASARRQGKLIYLLTDGAFPDNQKVYQSVKDRNADRSVLINTYLYGDCPQVAADFMQKLAEENGGRFKHIGADE